MASVSYSITREGANRIQNENDFTIGTQAPNAGDIEVRINTDTNSPTRRDILLGLKKIYEFIETHPTAPTAYKVKPNL